MSFRVFSKRILVDSRRDEGSPVTSHQSPVTSHQSPVTSQKECVAMNGKSQVLSNVQATQLYEKGTSRKWRIGLILAGGLGWASFTASPVLGATGDMRFDPDNSSGDEGLIQVFDGTNWGYVCDDDIDGSPAVANAMTVAQKHLGYTTCSESTVFTDFGAVGDFLLDDVNCLGTESSWYDCPRTANWSHNCSSEESFGISCTGKLESEEPKPKPPQKPGLPPLPPTMTLNVDTTAPGLNSVKIQVGKNYPGDGGTLGTCSSGSDCAFTLETATWALLTATAASGYRFERWDGSQYCRDGNPFMISNMSCKPVFSPLPPESPTALSATAVSENQIDLLWRDNSTRETGYTVERSSDQTTWNVITKTLANITTYSDLGLTCGATYYYRFTGYNNAGQSAPSSVINAVTVACPPPPVDPVPTPDPVTPPVVDPVTPPVVTPPPVTPDPVPPVDNTPPPPSQEQDPVEPPVSPPVEETPPPVVEPPPVTPEPTPVDPEPTEPTPPPVEPAPVVPETTENSVRPQGTGTSPVDNSPCPTDRHLNIHLDDACDAEGQTIEKLKIVRGGSLANAIITSLIESNEGLVSNIIFEKTAVLEGGHVTNFITNKGLMKNFTFVGQQIQGGTLGGIIIIASQVHNEIRDVMLAAGTVIQGKVSEPFVRAKLTGKITGDPNNPAKLENVTIVAGTQLDNVILGEGVILEEGVILGKNVTSADEKPVEPTPVCESNALGLDKQGNEVNDLKACFNIEPGKEGVKISIQVDPTHVGQKADLLMVVKVSATEWYSLDQTKWKAWNGSLASLKVKESFKVLPETVELEMASTEFNELGDSLTLFVGYQLQDGTIVYSQGESL